MFNKATKQKSKLRLLLEGPSGSGKTYSALLLASALGKKVAVIDTEKGSASLYSSEFEFDVCELSPPYAPEKYIEMIKFAEREKYDVLIIDSISHEWSGEGGCLDIQTKLGGRYKDWGKVTPRHNAFVEAILQSKMHIIGTARTKSDHLISEDAVSKKMQVTKVGTKTEQRDGLEYEFTTVLRLNQSHAFEASKDRTHLFDSKEDILRKDHALRLLDWLNEGIEPVVVTEEMVKIKMSQCKTLEDLGKFWSSLNPSFKLQLEEYKNECKNFLSHPHAA